MSKATVDAYNDGYMDGRAAGLAEGRRLAKKTIEPQVAVWTYKRGLAEGEAKGRRLELRALRSSFNRQPASHKDCILGDWVRHWLRTKPAKRKEGGR